MNNTEQNFLIDELHYQKTTGASDLSFKRIGGTCALVLAVLRLPRFKTGRAALLAFQRLDSKTPRVNGRYGEMAIPR